MQNGAATLIFKNLQQFIQKDSVYNKKKLDTCLGALNIAKFQSSHYWAEYRCCITSH